MTDDNVSPLSMQRYYHEGMVMELIPGQPPCMKAVDAINPNESIDCGKCLQLLITIRGVARSINIISSEEY